MKKNIPDIRSDYDKPNYDADKIAPYTLEDPLTFLDGSKVTNAVQWQKRRQEILDIFAKEMFGQEPPAPEALIIDIIDEKEDALAGFAVRTQYKMYFKADRTGPALNWIVLRPRFAQKPVPPILFLNYRGNHELIMDEDVIIPDAWIRYNNPDVPKKRGVMCDPNQNTYLPVGLILSAGYAIVSACYAEVSPDPEPNNPNCGKPEEFAYTRIFELWGKRDENRTDNITSLGAWAWALSRGIDMVEKIPQLDSEKCILTGCSRLGKAALLAAARDERVWATVPVQCGGGGATLAKRDYGENVATEMFYFPYWYCKAYKKYERNPAELLTFDQHLLVAAVAPRKLLIAGFDSPWFDTEGEYLSCKAASCAWEVCGKSGFPDVPYPDDFDTSAIGKNIGYYRRSQEHGIAAFDWLRLLEFVREQ